MLSALWVVCVSMWFFQHVPEVNGPGIASVYLQCIGQCPARAEWFRDEARSEFRAGWDGARSNPRNLGTRLHWRGSRAVV